MSNELEDMLKAVFTGTEVEVYRLDESGLAPIVRREPATREDWELHDSDTGELILPGDVVEFFRTGEQAEVTGGRPPHKVSSTGRVYVKPIGSTDIREYFPSVFNLKWRYVPK